jgi:hypothetical protein
MRRGEIFPDFARPGSWAAAVAVLLSAAIFSAVQARAQEAGCEGLIADIRGGLDYSVSIDATDQSVTIQTSEGDCREPVDTWVARSLPLSSAPAALEKGTPKISLQLGDDGLIVTPPDEALAPPPLIPQGVIGSPSTEDSLAPPSMIPRGMLKKPPSKEEIEATTATAAAIFAARAAKAAAEAYTADDESSGAAAEAASFAAEAISAAQAAKEAASRDDTAGAALAAAAAVEAAQAAEKAAARAAAGAETPESEAADAEAPPPETKKCTMDLGDFWEAGEHDIRGTLYWLAGVSTMDTDNDGQVDNVIFKIKSKGRVDNVIRYFGTGRLSGQSIPTLRLKDDRDVTRLCPGTLTFAEPKAEEEEEKAKAPPPKKKPKKADALDDSGKLTISASTLKENKHWFAIFGVIFLFAGGFGFFKTLRTLDKEKKRKAAIKSSALEAAAEAA